MKGGMQKSGLRKIRKWLNRDLEAILTAYTLP